MPEGQDWLIKNSDEVTLRLIPIAWFANSIAQGERLGPDYVICWPGCSDSISNQRLAISPLDLYVVEKMGALIDKRLLAPLIRGYAERLGLLPGPVKQVTDRWREFESCSLTHVRLLDPLDENQEKEIELKLRESANREVQNKILTAIAQLNAISNLCGHKALFSSKTSRGFDCMCEPCGTIWSLTASGDKRTFSMRPKEKSDLSPAEGFKLFGRDCLDFEEQEPS